MDGTSISARPSTSQLACKLVKAGVQVVGGFTAAASSHIRSMKSSLRAMGAQEVAHTQVKQSPVVSEITPAPLGERSRLGSLIASGTFVTMVEMVPPKGIFCEKELEGARMLVQNGVHLINVPDLSRAAPRARRAKSLYPDSTDWAWKPCCTIPVAIATC